MRPARRRQRAPARRLPAPPQTQCQARDGARREAVAGNQQVGEQGGEQRVGAHHHRGSGPPACSGYRRAGRAPAPGTGRPMRHAAGVRPAAGAAECGAPPPTPLSRPGPARAGRWSGRTAGIARRPTLMNTELPPHSSASRVTSATTAGVGASTLGVGAADFMRRLARDGSGADKCPGIRSNRQNDLRSSWPKLLPARRLINAADATVATTSRKGRFLTRIPAVSATGGRSRSVHGSSYRTCGIL